MTRETSTTNKQHVYAEVDPAYRIGAVRIDVLNVDDVTLAFDLADHELNICRFTRELALGKVKAALPLKEQDCVPNTMSVKIIQADGVEVVGHAQEAVYVKVSIRNFEHRTAKRALDAQNEQNQRVSISWEDQDQVVLPCPDPSAVLHCGLYRTGGWGRYPTLIGQWLITAKMLILAPHNVFVKSDTLKTYRGDARANSTEKNDKEKKSHRADAFILEGEMRLRDKQLVGATGPFDPSQETTIKLRIAYYYDAYTPSYQAILKQRPLTALEQLQFNSLETQRKLGDVRLVCNMLRDFPLLFDVRDIRFTHLNVYIRDLFTGSKGYEELKDSAKTSINSIKVIDRLAASHKRKTKNHVFLRKIDLGGRLGPQSHKDHIEGLDLYTLTKNFVQAAIVPVISQVDILGSLSEIFSGFLHNFASAPWSGTRLPMSSSSISQRRTDLILDSGSISDDDQSPPYDEGLETGDNEEREFIIDEDDDPDDIILHYDNDQGVEEVKEEPTPLPKFSAASIVNVKKHAANLRDKFQQRRKRRRWSQLSRAEMNMRKVIKSPGLRQRRPSSALPLKFRIMLQRRDSKLMSNHDQQLFSIQPTWSGFLYKRVARFDSIFMNYSFPLIPHKKKKKNKDKNAQKPKLIKAEVRSSTFFYTRLNPENSSQVLGFTKKIDLDTPNLYARYESGEISFRLPLRKAPKSRRQVSTDDTRIDFRKELYFTSVDDSSLHPLWCAISRRPPPTTSASVVWHTLQSDDSV
eukprot:CAMPEP_0197319428 /NCGR_PEP_ID=MMETSP0891-20130614/54823_1 /TAXON_ID=44058 ORGANISM="Aureoumbra lagunensis, Strain CCMP1510" /NCGR_SAMPLE_ID=MMETSP0891 /ASSEMBLY_ACC=CAM_ASM_000534 /LENGTH=747 /DNA_ID=CAMNT_0042810353 /DNA_START=1587 /DNA_END=3830 /DNA_ORIENTATION=+